MMKVLLIAHSYPPDPFVGAFRAAKVAEAFRRRGHEVEVVTARRAGESPGLRHDSSGLRVHPVYSAPHPRHLFVWLKERLFRGSAEAESRRPVPCTRPSTARERKTSRWKRLLLSALWIPDDLQGFIPPAVVKSLLLFREGVDLVYTTAPPFSDHLAGLLLKHLTGIRWVAEFRDPWSDNPEKAERVRSAPADAVNRWLERSCLLNADRIVAVAESTRDLLAQKLPPSRRDRIVLALNGIDELVDPRDHLRPAGPFRIVYAGSFAAGRDPRPFLQALAVLQRDRGLGPADIEVEFISRSPLVQGVSLLHFAAELGIAELVRFTAWMPQRECRQRMYTADLLLLLFWGHRIQIPNKLYDYLGARRPILALVDAEGEAARMLRRTAGHYVVLHDEPAKIRDALEQALLSSAEERSLPLVPTLVEWRSSEQMQRLMEAVLPESDGDRETARSAGPIAAEMISGA